MDERESKRREIEREHHEHGERDAGEDYYGDREWVARDMLDTPPDKPWAHTLGLLMIGMVLGLMALSAIAYFMY